MFEIRTEIELIGLKANKICDFLINCTDDSYQRWWPGTHLVYHTIKFNPQIVGNIVVFDEYIGKYRFKSKGIITKYVPEREIILQIEKIIRLPIWLQITFTDTIQGVKINHSIHAGFKGMGKMFDFIFRLFLSKEFEKEMDNHAKYEFEKLRNVIA